MKRPTPDTDAVAAYEGNWDTKALRMTAHARKLERERDEARELIDDIWITATSDHRFIMPPSKKQIPQHIEGIIKAYDKAHDDWTPEEIKTLMRERDEAREALEHIVECERDKWEQDALRYCKNSEYHREMREKAERERDEAQRELEMWKFERDEAMEHAACYRLEANKLIMMGIELREQNAKLRDLMEKAIDCVTCNSDLRRLCAELDRLKEGAK